MRDAELWAGACARANINFTVLNLGATKDACDISHDPKVGTPVKILLYMYTQIKKLKLR